MITPTNQIKSNQIKSNQIKSNQIKSNQIKSNQSSLTADSLKFNSTSDTHFLKSLPNPTNALSFSPKLARFIAPLGFALKAKSDDLRLNSSSGGAFSLIAENVIKRGGVVFGVAFDEDLKVRHEFVENLADLAKIRRSKYVESFVGGAFKEALNFLKAGRLVLFSGTQCQIHALNAFLRHSYENLLTIEVVCNSVPSAKIWEIYKESFELEFGEKMVDFNFRGKNYGWENYAIIAKSKSKTKVVPNANSPYLHACWATHLITRKSCANCYSKGFVSGADFTLGDFWGIRAWHSDFVDDKGVSCVLAHSQKALDIVANLECELRKVPAFSIIAGNPAMITPNSIHPKRDEILRKTLEIHAKFGAKKAMEFLQNATNLPTQTSPQNPPKSLFYHYYLVYKNDPIRRKISLTLKKFINKFRKDKK